MYGIFEQKYQRRLVGSYLLVNSQDAFGFYQNVTVVPHAAITTPVAMIIPSKGVQTPSITTLATTGPTMDNMNAEKDPRMAIMELNSGIKMDTTTTAPVRRMRCAMPMNLLQLNDEPVCATDKPSGLSARSSGDENRISVPSKISIIALSCKAVSFTSNGSMDLTRTGWTFKANLELYFNEYMHRGMNINGSQWAENKHPQAELV